MKKIGISKGIWKPSLAVLGALAGLALAPASAQAQVCGDLEEIADDLLDEYFDELGDFFTLSEKTCDSMTSTFFKACTTAVKDSVKCFKTQFKSLPKAAKPACKENFEDPSDCEQSFKNDEQLLNNIIAQEAEFANDDCEDAADDFWDVCRFGFGS
jgi:hypothetical protein